MDDLPPLAQAWREQQAIAVAHAAGFAGTHWHMGPEELAHLLNVAAIAVQPPQPQAEPVALTDKQIADLSLMHTRMEPLSDFDYVGFARAVLGAAKGSA